MKNLSSFLNFLIFTLIVVIGGAFYYLKAKPQHKTVQSSMSAQQVDDIVNKHIKSTVRENRLTKAMNEKAMLDAKNKLNELARLRRIKQDEENVKIPLERQIWKENKVADEPTTPAEVIDRIANEKREQEKIIEAEKQEYARQWIQNARREGYLLELSPDLEVIKYTPIRKPSQEDDSIELYPSN